MFGHLGKLYGDLKALTHQRLSILVFILLLGVNQLIYSSVPLALFLNLLFLGAALHLYNVRFHEQYKRHGILVSLYILVSYGFSLLSHGEFLVFSLFSLSLLWIYMNVAIYLMGGEPFLENFMAGLLQLLRAGLYFGILYGIIYLISYLINQVFFLNLPYNGVVFRLANSLSSMAGLLVLFAGKSEARPGKFFVVLFGQIFPKLAMLFGFLALVYSVQTLLGYTALYPSFIFYALVLLFYLGFVLSHRAGIKPWERKTLLLLFLSLSFVYLLIRLNVFGQVKQGIKGRSDYHEFLLLGGFILLQIHLLLQKKEELGGFKYYVVFVLLVCFLPPFGMTVHEGYDLSDVNKKTEYTELEKFTREKERREFPSRVQENKSLQYSYSRGNGSTKEYSIQGYSYLAELNWFKGQRSSYSYKEFKLSMEDGKRLIIEQGDQQEVLDLYDEVQKRKGNELWIYQGKEVKLIFLNYYQTEDYYQLEFKALFK